MTGTIKLFNPDGLCLYSLTYDVKEVRREAIYKWLQSAQAGSFLQIRLHQLKAATQPINKVINIKAPRYKTRRTYKRISPAA